jgi:hypothetical protein
MMKFRIEGVCVHGEHSHMNGYVDVYSTSLGKLHNLAKHQYGVSFASADPDVIFHNQAIVSL